MSIKKRRLHVILGAAGIAAATALVSARSFTQINPPTITTSRSPGTINPPTTPSVTEGAFIAQTNQVAVGADAPVVVTQMFLKPGQYLLDAKVVGVNGSQQQVALACGLTTVLPWAPQDNGEIDYSSVTIAPESRLPLSLVGTMSTATARGVLPGGVTIALACRSSGGPVTVRWAKLTALAVPRIN
jgi:hypothetical protein